MTTQKQLIIVSALTLLTSVAGAFFVSESLRSREIPIRNLLKQGRVDEAMAQARVLLAALKAANWNRAAIDQKLLRLPDQDFAESSIARSPGDSSFMTGYPGSVYESKVAFWCELYVRNNATKELASPEGQRWRPDGFIIVGWKAGQVTQVPIDQVRLYPTHYNGKDVWLHVFPGMSEYSEDLQKYPGVD